LAALDEELHSRRVRADIYRGTQLRVTVTPAEDRVAMRAMASRPASDADDIRTLIGLLGIRTRTAVLDVVREHFPDDPGTHSRT
jgi:hypothetical protein